MKIVGIFIPTNQSDQEMAIRLRQYSPAKDTTTPCISYGLCNGHALTSETAKQVDELLRQLDSHGLNLREVAG